MENYMSLLINLATLDRNRGNYKHAEQLLDTAYILAEGRKNAEMMANVQSVRADLFATKGDFRRAFNYQKEFIKIKEQYLDEERVKAVNEMMTRYESEKKARQIQQLELDNLDATLENERIRNGRNRFMYVGIVVLLIALALGSRLSYVRRSRAALQREKDISEGLLLNILPSAVATELKQKGFADARHYQSATILFSDFKSFTEISEQLNPAELVEEINVCFKAFDEIVTRYGIEKIKTLGDAYMAAGGITDGQSDPVLQTVRAGIEMQDFIRQRKRERDIAKLPAFEMRIGIHTGPVVAGIVGVKKFQYDLWGDTVNIASRMESNGESGRVNISEATYQQIQDNPTLVFTPRGLIQAKGKGRMAMYFVDYA
jgi:class 3 adenylate cyclase